MLHEEMILDGDKPIKIQQRSTSDERRATNIPDTPGMTKLELIKQGRRLAAEAVENTDGSIVAAYEELAKRDPAAAIRHIAADIAGAAASNLQEAL